MYKTKEHEKLNYIPLRMLRHVMQEHAKEWHTQVQAGERTLLWEAGAYEAGASEADTCCLGSQLQP